MRERWEVGIALAATFALASCTREPLAAQHTVADYRANVNLRREVFARCTNDPGTLASTPDCVNAREAERLEDIGSVRSAPPIQLNTPSSRK